MVDEQSDQVNSGPALRNAVNDAAKAGQLLSVYRTIYDIPTSTLFSELRALAKPLPNHSPQEVEDLFTRALKADDTAWQELNPQNMELGVIAFRGEKAGEVAEAISRMGGNVAMIPGRKLGPPPLI